MSDPFTDFFNNAGKTLGDFGYNAQKTLGIIPKTSTPAPTAPDPVTQFFKDNPVSAATKAAVQQNHHLGGSGEVTRLGGTSLGDPRAPYVGQHTYSPNGCQNCNYGDTWCELMKIGCEGQKAIPWQWLLIGGGMAGLLLVLVLIKR